MDSAPVQGHNSNIAVYDEFRGQLSELRDANAKTVFDYEDPKGNKDARSHVYKLRQTKSAVEMARKEEKAESLAYGRRVDEQAQTDYERNRSHDRRSCEAAGRNRAA